MDFNSFSLSKEFSQVSVLSQLTGSVFSFGTPASSGLGVGADIVEVEVKLEVDGEVVKVARVVFGGESSTSSNLHCRKLEADIVKFWL